MSNGYAKLHVNCEVHFIKDDYFAIADKVSEESSGACTDRCAHWLVRARQHGGSPLT